MGVKGPEVVRGAKPDPLVEAGADLARRFQTVAEMPVCVNLWKNSNPAQSLGVSFAVKARGDRVSLDLRKPDTRNPKSQGPTASWPAPPVSVSPPFCKATLPVWPSISTRTSLVCILAVDFKGGALVEGIEELPRAPSDRRRHQHGWWLRRGT